MKTLKVFACIIVFFALLVSCATNNTLTPTWQGQDNSLTTLISDINSKRPSLVKGADYIEKFKKEYMNFSPDYAKSITQEEARALITIRDQKESITYQEAVEDVDLYFRMLRYRLGRYDFLGGDKVFYAVRDRILAKLANYKSTGISTNDLAYIMADELKFMDDCHMKIGDYHIFYQYSGPDLIHLNFLSNLYFDKDDSGYYLTENSTKYYFVSCSTEEAEIVPFLNGNGELVYSLILETSFNNRPAKTTVIVSSSTEEKKITVHWEELPSDYLSDGLVYKESGNLAYLGLTNCSTDVENQLQQLAMKANKKDVVIIDLRSNNGTHGYNFLPYYLGTSVSLDEVAFTRRGMTNDFGLQPGQEEVLLTEVSGRGKVVNSPNLTVVLVDKNTGCAPEEFAKYFQFVNNTVIVGSITKGHLDGGSTLWWNENYDQSKYDMETLHLPNSGLSVLASTALSLYGDYESMVGKGFKPDIYVADTSLALDNVLSLLVNQNIITESEAQGLFSYGTKKTQQPEQPTYSQNDLEPLLKLLLEVLGDKLDESDVSTLLSSKNAGEKTASIPETSMFQEEIEMEKIDSEYGSYFELKATLTPENPTCKFSWSDDPRNATTYRIEFTSTANRYTHLDSKIYYGNGGDSGGDIYGGEMKYSFNPNVTSYGHGTVFCDSVLQEPIEVILRLIPYNDPSLKLVRGNFGVEEGETRQILEIIDRNPENMITIWTPEWQGFYEYWENNFFLDILDKIKNK